jgi:hypothetical protein
MLKKESTDLHKRYIAIDISLMDSKFFSLWGSFITLVTIRNHSLICSQLIMKRLLTLSFVGLALTSPGSDPSRRCRPHLTRVGGQLSRNGLSSTALSKETRRQYNLSPPPATTATKGPPARPSPNNGPIPPGEQPSQEQCNGKIGRHGPNSTRAAFLRLPRYCL